ncbi:hypothetical protein ABZ863_20540 [Saccharomonospora sp. NPDC046836]|uniref:hypothetical protein n=1 Tax=Saccharomonospora sp. NPDC046836 TaxID=3156921 RepID=UPI0033F25940
MATTAAITTQGAGRVRRWLSRALLVAGGTVAATAAAWAVSTASASAASADNDPAQPEPTAATGTAPEIRDLLAAAEPVDVQAQPFQFGDGKLGADVKRSVDHVWENAVVRPVGETVDTVTRLLTTPQDPRDLGQEFWDALQPRGGTLVPLPDLSGLPAVGGTDDSVSDAPVEEPGLQADETVAAEPVQPEHSAPAAAQDGPVEQQVADHSAPVETETSAPVVDQDKESAPTAPLRLPVVPSSIPSPTGVHGGPHLDGTLFGVPAGFVAAFDDAVIGSIRSGVRYLPTQPGSQPGVTPD